MEFENQYLTYNEYVQLGGTLEEAPFNLIEFEARKIIDDYTFSRLKNLAVQKQEVKICIFKMIKSIESSEKTLYQNNGISSENIDGYSVSYSQADINFLKSNVAQNKSIIEHYLSECKLDDGTPYLYLGG